MPAYYLAIHLLNTYYMPDPRLGTGNIEVNTIDKVPTLFASIW